MTARITLQGRDWTNVRHRTAGMRARSDGPLLTESLPIVPRALRWLAKFLRGGEVSRTSAPRKYHG